MEEPTPITGNVVLNGYVDVPEHRIGDVMNALGLHIELTRAEPGCLYFSVVQDVESPLRLNVSEIFVDRTAFEHHQKRAGGSVWAAKTKGIERHFNVVDVA